MEIPSRLRYDVLLLIFGFIFIFIPLYLNVSNGLQILISMSIGAIFTIYGVGLIKDEYEIDADIKELEYIKSKYELLSCLESKQLLTKDAKEHYAAILKKRLVKT